MRTESWVLLIGRDHPEERCVPADRAAVLKDFCEPTAQVTRDRQRLVFFAQRGQDIIDSGLHHDLAAYSAVGVGQGVIVRHDFGDAVFLKLALDPGN